MVFREGQILNFKYDNPVSNTIATVMGHYWTHTAIVVSVQGDKIFLLEALGTYRDEKYENKGFTAKLRFWARIKEFFGGKVVVSAYSKEQLSKLSNDNKLKIMDFKFQADKDFADLVTYYKDRPYDYFGALSIGFKRLFSIFGKEYQNDVKTLNKLFCSELAARILNEMTNFEIRGLANKESFEEISPQDISLIYDKLKLHYKI